MFRPHPAIPSSSSSRVTITCPVATGLELLLNLCTRADRRKKAAVPLMRMAQDESTSDDGTSPLRAEPRPKRRYFRQPNVSPEDVERCYGGGTAAEIGQMSRRGSLPTQNGHAPPTPSSSQKSRGRSYVLKICYGEDLHHLHRTNRCTCEMLGKQFIKKFPEDSFVSQSVLPGSCDACFLHLQGKPNSPYKGVSIGQIFREDIAMRLTEMASPRASKVFIRMIEFLF
ncbi:unnamed protein product [Mytilus edulis]|uniref:Uncharacterized protein n=1 Tax=Mytilus edulis TaxID=6550 RepID=A0A8S3UFT2_MYTED|nr:unnamed protein product [Mytilus edulis]